MSSLSGQRHLSLSMAGQPLSGENTQGASFQNILNFRDVGKTINQLSGPSIKFKDGLLFRSARPDSATSLDRSRLRNEYKIKTIIDLRSKTEHIAAAKTHSDAVAVAQSAAVPASNDEVATPLKIPEINYAEVNLNGKGFERALLWQLSWGSLARLVGLMALGYRTEGIAILGREVMRPKGLIGLGIDTLEYSGQEMKEAFDVLADQSNYPILVHCTQGKDRTGLVVILVLMLCEADLSAITNDYLMSEEQLEPEKAERMKEIRSIGLDESFAGCPPEFVGAIVHHIDKTYGDIVTYLKTIGVSEDAQRKILDILLLQKRQKGERTSVIARIASEENTQSGR